MFYFLAILFALLPTYTVRFHIGSVPWNLLEALCALFFLFFVIWVSRNKQHQEFISLIKGEPKILQIFIALFFISGLVSALVNISERSIGLFIVFFLFPLLLYYPIKFILRDPISKARFIRWMLIVVGIYSLYGIIQYFTLIGVPEQWWGNSVEPKRILSFFEYPNAFALYLAPLLAFLLPFVFAKPGLDSGARGWMYKLCYLISIGALLLTLSRGAWVGFIAALAVFALIGAGKKASMILAVGLIICASVVYAFPNLRYRVILPFVGEKSSVSRLSLWQTAGKMIEDSPVLGKGLYGYQTNFNKYNTDPNLEALNYPHNIFLNFWVDTGLLGLISFLAICALIAWRSFKYKGLINIGVILFLVALFAHGMIDAPYFKNDLALLFWIILAL